MVELIVFVVFGTLIVLSIVQQRINEKRSSGSERTNDLSPEEDNDEIQKEEDEIDGTPV